MSHCIKDLMRHWDDIVAGVIVGYARTSTNDQKAGLEAQIEELKAAGCEKIFFEQVSSVDAVRPELKAALQFLREGDSFICTRPDRLARSTTELLNIVESLSDRGVCVRLLSMNIDTSNATGKLLLTLMAGISTFERQLMLERQRHGIAAGNAAGRYKGRQPTARAKSAEVLALAQQGKRVAEIVRTTGISRASVYRILEAEKVHAS